MTDKKLWLDIQAQEDNLRSVIAHLYGPERPRLEAAGRFLRNDRPIAFIGVASAAYLCTPAQYYLGQNGRYASVVYAADTLYHLLPMLRGANVIINSRSGETAEIVRLTGRCRMRASHSWRSRTSRRARWRGRRRTSSGPTAQGRSWSRSTS